MNVVAGDVHFSWETTSVIVNFVITECNATCDMTLLEAVQELTAQTQNHSSALYTNKRVTSMVDFDYGLNVVNWDISLKLTYPIQNIGHSESIADGNLIKHGKYYCC